MNRDQFLRKLKENGKDKNVPFSKWLEILAGEDLPPKLYCSENGDLKSGANNEEDDECYIDRLLNPRVNKCGNNATWL